MTSTIWSRDSHGLYDYESKHLTRKRMRTNEPLFILQRSNDLNCVSYDEDRDLKSQIEDWKEGSLPDYQNRLYGRDKVVKPILCLTNKNNVFYLQGLNHD
jgi:hypothetical protein